MNSNKNNKMIKMMIYRAVKIVIGHQYYSTKIIINQAQKLNNKCMINILKII